MARHLRNLMISLWQWSDHGRGESVVDLCNSLENDLQGGSMSKKLHNFDLKGLQWSTLGRPRGSGHGNGEATSADSSMFVFKADRGDGTTPSELAESLRNLSVPREKAVERHLQKGQQVKNGDLPSRNDLVGGGHLLTKQIDLTKVSGKAEMTSGSGSCEGEKRWNLRGRKPTGFWKDAGSSSHVAGSSTRGPYKGGEKGLNVRGGEKMQMPSLPRFSPSVTKAEARADLCKILGKPPPKKLKKRARTIQRLLDPLFPGLYLGSISLDRYDVKENLPSGKGK